MFFKSARLTGDYPVKKLRYYARIALVVAFISAIFAMLLLLNVTAPNPTGRRYSSDTVNLSESNYQKGITGERILEQDLGVPNNNTSGNTQCICGENTSTVGSKCSVCVVRSQSVANHRIPDFITTAFIADSKNVASLNYPSEISQIRDMAVAAEDSNRTLWIFVRVNTEVAAELHVLVRSTGGDIVRYFAVPGHADPVDQLARLGLLGALVVFIISGVFEASLQVIGTRPTSAPPAPKSPRTKRDPDALRKVLHGTDAAEEFLNRAQDAAHRDLDRRTRLDLEDDNDNAE
jgi:hypothetical protein